MEIKYTCSKCGTVPLKEVYFDQYNPNWHIKCGSSVLTKVVPSSEATLPTSIEFDYNGYHLEASRGRFRAVKDGKLVSSAMDCFPRGTPTKEEVIKFWNFVHTED